MCSDPSVLKRRNTTAQGRGYLLINAQVTAVVTTDRRRGGREKRKQICVIHTNNWVPQVSLGRGMVLCGTIMYTVHGYGY